MGAKVTDVIFPSSVTKIEESAFFLTEITNLNLPGPLLRSLSTQRWRNFLAVAIGTTPINQTRTPFAQSELSRPSILSRIDSSPTEHK